MITAEQVHWLAGLLEGEGTFCLERRGRVIVQLIMTDKDIVDRVHAMLGFGNRSERELPSGLIAYGWGVVAQANTAGLMMTLLPLMGERRRCKIIECLEAWKKKPLPRGMQTHCKYGHELSGYNLVIVHEGKHTKRQCRICRNRRHVDYIRRRNAA